MWWRRADRPEPRPKRIQLDGVRLDGRRSSVLELDTLSLQVGECLLVAGEPGQGHTALALVATGRMLPTSGTVELLDGDGTVSTSSALLRRVTALVDLPGVSEPDEVVPLHTVVAEELAYAHRPARAGRMNPWLDSQGLLDRRNERFEDLYGGDRTELLTRLAAQRLDVRFLVLTLPDRHGGDPRRWWGLAQEFAGQGYGVLAQCLRPTARDLGATLPTARGPEALRRRPVEALRVVVDDYTGEDQQADASDPPREDEDAPTTRFERLTDDGSSRSPQEEADP